MFEIGSDLFILFLSLILFSAQLFLCFKKKNIFIRLIPTIFLFILTLIFFGLIFLSDGWDSLGFLLLSICSLFLLGVCGLSWLIWFIIKKIKKL